MTRHLERKRNISNKVYMRFFGLRPLNDDIYLGLVPFQSPHQIFFLFYCEEKREPVLSVSACVEQDEQDNTTMAPFQIFDLSGVKIYIG